MTNRIGCRSFPKPGPPVLSVSEKEKVVEKCRAFFDSLNLAPRITPKTTLTCGRVGKKWDKNPTPSQQDASESGKDLARRIPLRVSPIYPIENSPKNQGCGLPQVRLRIGSPIPPAPPAPTTHLLPSHNNTLDTTHSVPSMRSSSSKLTDPKAPPPEKRSRTLYIEPQLKFKLAHEHEVLIYSTENPRILFAVDDLMNAIALRELLFTDSAHGVEKESFEIRVFSLENDLKKIAFPSSIEAVFVLANDPGADSHKHIVRTVNHFLEKDIIVKLAIPPATSDYEVAVFHHILGKPKGLSKAARVIASAPQIRHISDIDQPGEMLKVALQKVRNQSAPASTTTKRESPESRIKNALETYERGEPVKPGNIIEVNLLLRGITQVPPSFRAALLRHPDLTDIENGKMRSSQDKRVGILTSLKQQKSLLGQVLEYDNAYWRIEDDERTASCSILLIRNPTSRCFLIVRGESVILAAKTVINSTKTYPTETVQNPEMTCRICHFRQYVRLIPYYVNNVLKGVERTFFGPGAGKLSCSGSYKKHVRSKLARGFPSGASVVLFDEGEPHFEMRGEGSENVLSAIEALQRIPSLAKEMGISDAPTSNPFQLNCRVSACIGINDLIKMPIDPRTKTILLIADNDGYNAETHQTIIDTVGALLEQRLIVKIAFPLASVPGEKIDLNDVLLQSGVEAVGEVLRNAVEIRDKSDLEPPDKLIQFQFLVLKIEKQLKQTCQKQDPSLRLELGNVYFQLKKYRKALSQYEICATELKRLGMLESETGAKVYYAMGRTWIHLQEYDSAEDALEMSIDLFIKTSKNRISEEIALVLDGMAQVRLRQGNPRSALSYCLSSLDMVKQSVEEKHHPSIALICDTQAAISCQQHRYAEALNLYKKSLSIKEHLSGSKPNPSIVNTLKHMGHVYFKAHEKKHALDCYQKALQMTQKIFTSERYGIDTDLIRKIGHMFFLKGMYPTSVKYYTRSFQAEKQPSQNPVLKMLLRRAHVIGQDIGDQRASPSSLSSPPYALPMESARSVGSLLSSPASLNLLPPFLEDKKTQIKAYSPHNFLSSTNQLLIRQRFPFWCPKPGVPQVCLDVEHTGFGIGQGGRITEVGCVKLINGCRMEDEFQAYVNPETKLSHAAHKITGLTLGFLQQFPLFPNIAKDFLSFIHGSDLVIHDAKSDLAFLNHELQRAGYSTILESEHAIIDTLQFAKSLHPNESNGLDALAGRYGIDSSSREHRHTAIEDARLLSDTYIAMVKGEISIRPHKYGSFQKI